MHLPAPHKTTFYKQLSRIVLAIAIANGINVQAAETETPLTGTTFHVARYVIDGPDAIGIEEATRVLAPHLGEKSGMAGLQSAVQALQSYLQDRGFGLYNVILPPQEVGDSVHLQVMDRPLARIVAGQDVDSAQISQLLPGLQEGQTPNLNELERSLRVVNEAPHRQITVAFSESTEPGHLDARVDAALSSPWSTSLKLDNTGSDQPARSRANAVLGHSDLFGLGHSLTASYTTSPDASDAIRQGGLFYKAPLYSEGASASAYYFESNSSSGVVLDGFTVQGSGRFAGISLTQQLFVMNGWLPSLQVSYDDKYFGDGSAFNSTPMGHDVRSTPISFTFAARKVEAGRQTHASVSFIANLTKGDHNDDASYALVRSGAESRWSLLRMDGSMSFEGNSGWTYVAKGSAQISTQPLIGGEQFGMGGQDGLRALETRQLQGDSGWQATLECWTPALAEGLRLVAFAEAGKVFREKPVSPTTSAEAAADVGFGLRWQVAKQVSFSLDYATLLNDVPGMGAGRERVYATLSWQL